MPLTNSTRRYGGLSKAFHWLTAAAILAMFPLGLIANQLALDLRAPGATPTEAELARVVALFSTHKTLGVAVFLLALARIGWSLSQPRPGLLNGDRPLEAFAAETVHWLLYGSLVIVPLTGWGHHAATTGFAPILWPFGQDLPFLPKNADLAHLLAGAHQVTVKVMALAVLLHVAGALKHHLIDRDATLRRMLPGRSDAPLPPARRPHPPAPLAALAVWALALGLGAALGSFSGAPTAQGVSLQAKASDWTVEFGTLGLRITQMGAEVTGEFADWSAAITFVPRDTPGPAGQVDVQIAVGSLGLGSVTDQALGADFLDAAGQPVALFTAPITRDTTGYRADGTLSLRGAAVAVALPFTLTLDQDLARMEGRALLDRRQFNIGAGIPDAATLGFDVAVDVALTARRN